MIRNLSLIFTAGFLLFTAPAVYGAPQQGAAGENSKFQSWIGQETATGDWGGARSKLEGRGFTVSSNYTADIGGNPTGGLKQIAVYSSFLDLALAMDFEKIASIKGLALTISSFLASGRNLSALIGNFYGVQEIYAPGNYYFGQLDLSLSVLDDTWTFEAGRLFAGDVFATSPLWQYYLTSGVNNNLNSMPANIFFPAFQVTSWATRVTYQPNKDWHIIAGIYDANPKVSKINNQGADFSFEMDSGYLAIGQLTYKHGHNPKENGLPGSFCFGSYYESSKFQDLANPGKTWRGNYGFYLICDQMIYRGDWPEFTGPSHMKSEASQAERTRNPYHPQTAISADRPKGLTVWGGAYLAPQEHTNTQTYQLAAGLVYQGLPPNRDLDVTAFGIVMGHFSDLLDGQGIETVLEFNHRFQLGPWCYFTPDIQYIIHPNGQTNIDDALVLGMELSFNF